MTPLKEILEETKFLAKRSFRTPEVPNEPMFSNEIRCVFESRIRKCGVYLEFGAGGSTVIAAKHVKQGISIESDRFFAKAVQRHVSRFGHRSMRVIHANIGITGRLGIPLIKYPTRDRIERWSAYFDNNCIREIITECDLVLIDGRFRVASFLNVIRLSAEKKKGTCILFDDFFDRGYYRTAREFAKPVERHGNMGEFVIPDSIEEFPKLEDLLIAGRDFR